MMSFAGKPVDESNAMEPSFTKDALGDRMKSYETVETERRLDATSTPVYARIDGRGFSRFTKGLRRPFDTRMSSAMIAATSHLVEQTNARMGYTQSDEISLIWLLDGENPSQEMFFGGKVQKLVSVLAAMATAAFTRAVLTSGDAEFAAYVEKMPHFDARVFALPSREEGANAFLWRELDAQRNAISMTAHSMFSHKALQGVSQEAMLRMIENAEVEFEEYPVFFRRGTFLRRVTRERMLTQEEWEAIPERHRPDPATPVLRSSVEAVEMPPFRTVTNRVEVIFDGAEPVT